jgi:hypothetical protein
MKKRTVKIIIVVETDKTVHRWRMAVRNLFDGIFGIEGTKLLGVRTETEKS